jgi:hypothetical protein
MDVQQSQGAHPPIVPDADETAKIAPVTGLDDRYSRRPRPRWLWPLVAVIGVAIGVAWAAWVAFQPRPVTAVLHSYDVTSDTSITLTLQIHRSERIAVTCDVYAQAQDHSIVGERTVRFAATARETVRETVTLTTVQRAVTGVLKLCQPAD